MQNKVAVFASGNGTNAERLFEYFNNHPSIEISALFCNNESAPVLGRASKWKIPTISFGRKELYHSSKLVNDLKELDIDWIVLAGFLWLLPSNLVTRYPNKIINLHPSLLPKYGGKGMYGENVHKAVLENKEEESGITIHLVTEHYDSGRILFQATCEVKKDDTPDSLAERIHQLEYANLPLTLENLVLRRDTPT